MESQDNPVAMLSKEGTTIRNLLKSLKTIEKLQKDPINNLHKIKQEMGKAEKALESSKLEESFKNKIEQHINDIRSKIAAWEEEIKDKFGINLENELKKMGFELAGHYPLLKTSFYTLQVDLDNFKVIIWYGPQQERLDVARLVPAEVASKLRKIHESITQRPFDSKGFLSKIYEAYKASLYRLGKEMGDQVPISDVLLEYVLLIQDKKFRANPVKRNYREYGRVFFSYDLYRLKDRIMDNKELDLITATRAYTKHWYDFLWIPSNEKGEGIYISHIKFREVEA
jgi:gas vesicle protein